MKIVIGVTGASGVVLAQELLKNLKSHETHLIISSSAKKIIKHESNSLEKIKSLANFYYHENDLEAKISSSSNLLDAMVIVPCSMKTLSSIANGFSNNLITRVAENMLRFNQKLILVPRETPLSLAALENMVKVKKAGAILIPPNMAYYYQPKNLSDVNNFFLGKILDSLRIKHNLYRRWKEK